MTVGKKGAVYGVITLMLCVAVYLNWSYTKDAGDLMVANDKEAQIGSSKIYGEATLVDNVDQLANAQAVSQENYFAEARISKEKAKDQAISILKTTVDNENSTDDAKNNANKQIQTLAQNAVKEARIESLIKAKGYSEAVVFLTDDGINAIVSATVGGFTQSDVAKIKDIVIAETSVSAEFIKIVEAK